MATARELELLDALEAALEWIDAVPKDTILPVMPGFDRDWVDALVEGVKAERGAAPVETPAEETAKAGYVMADLLASTLMPKSTDDDYRTPSVWEHNALCWLVRNRSAVPTINYWTATLLEEGYPTRAFRDFRGIERPAGFFWNASMEHRE